MEVSNRIDELVATSENLSCIKESIALSIPCEPDTQNGRANLKNKSFDELLLGYVNWCDRSIAPRPRATVFHPGFWQSGSAYQFRREIFSIAAESESGRDLQPWLSPDIGKIGFVQSSDHASLKFGVKDVALIAYGIHHLHLKPARQSGKRCGKSDELIFAVASRNQLRFLTFGTHESFYDGTVEQAKAELLFLQGLHLRDVVGMSYALNAKERQIHLRRGVNTLTPINGVYVSAGLISTAGTSLRHQQHVDGLIETIEDLEPKIRERFGRKQICRTFDLPFDADMRFGWALKYADLYLVETKSRRAIAAWEWLR